MTRRFKLGFTLIEVILAIVVIGVGMAGILSVYNTTMGTSADPLAQKQALAISESLLEEILQKEYSKPVGSTVVPYGTVGWSRASFDTVTDYHNYTSTTIVDAAGSPVAGLSDYIVSPAVSVTATTLNGVAVQRVVVSVTGRRDTVTLTGYRGNY